ncbi:MAG: hypothetical protein HC853_01400 [Anaerolineae bacterium]|nr:hypothetical protein [Anaerolineae bacterium]
MKDHDIALCVALEIDLESRLMSLQVYKLSWLLFLIGLAVGIALFFTSIWAAVVVVVVVFSLVNFIIQALMEFREVKKCDEILRKYSEAQAKLETLKAMLSVGAALGQWKS